MPEARRLNLWFTESDEESLRGIAELHGQPSLGDAVRFALKRTASREVTPELLRLADLVAEEAAGGHGWRGHGAESAVPAKRALNTRLRPEDRAAIRAVRSRFRMKKNAHAVRFAVRAQAASEGLEAAE